MATAKKTIKVPVNFNNHADLANQTKTNIGTAVIYVVENTATHPVTFTNVALFVALQDAATATGTSLADFKAYITLTGATEMVQNGSLSGGTWSTGENWGGVIGPLDFTNHFVSGFTASGESHPCSVSLFTYCAGGTGLTTRGYYCWFELTYTYDTTETRRMATIAVPFESSTGALATTSGAAYPTLYRLTGNGGMLSGYTSPVIQYRWLEVKGNFCANGGGTATTDATINFNVDSAGTITFPLRESALATEHGDCTKETPWAYHHPLGTISGCGVHLQLGGII